MLGLQGSSGPLPSFCGEETKGPREVKVMKCIGDRTVLEPSCLSPGLNMLGLALFSLGCKLGRVRRGLPAPCLCKHAVSDYSVHHLPTNAP